MTALWIALGIAAIGSYLLKLAGMSLPEHALNHPRVQRIAAFLPIAMLSALVAVDLFGRGDPYGIDLAVLTGMAAAVVALLLRQGLLVVFGAAVVVTAMVRLLGG